jgi:hypothetical protein
MAMTLITTNPDSTDVANVSFTSSIDNTYKLFIFKFYDINPATDETFFSWNGSIDGGSNYNVTKTSTAFYVEHAEADGDENLAYSAAADVAQGTGYQNIARGLGNGADESLAGYLYLFNPSNTTYVKHFYASGTFLYFGEESLQYHTSGYFNTTSAINAVDFKMSSGNMDGVIKMYGVG